MILKATRTQAQPRAIQINWLATFRSLRFYSFSKLTNKCEYWTDIAVWAKRDLLSSFYSSLGLWCYRCGWASLLQVLEIEHDHVGPFSRHVLQYQVSEIDRNDWNGALQLTISLSPFILLQNLLDFFQVIMIFQVQIVALVGDEFALLQQLLEVRSCSVSFVSNVITEFSFALNNFND